MYVHGGTIGMQMQAMLPVTLVCWQQSVECSCSVQAPNLHVWMLCCMHLLCVVQYDKRLLGRALCFAMLYICTYCMTGGMSFLAEPSAVPSVQKTVVKCFAVEQEG